MSTPAFAMRDTATMMRRDLRHALRYPAMTVTTVVVPVFMMLMFNYVFGNTISAGFGALQSNAIDYIDYLAPAIMLMAVGSGTAAIAVNIASDVNEGIVDRFRTMAIFRAAVLAGQVLGGMMRIMTSVLLVFGVALLVGFRPNATPWEWFAAIGVVAMFAFALTWLTIAFGLLAKGPEAANASTMPVQFLLPFTSSAFVDPESMPKGLRWFAEYQPFTAVIETVRGLLLGTPIGHNAMLAIGWCLGLTLVGYFWSRSIFLRSAPR